MKHREKLWTSGDWKWADHGVGEIVVFSAVTENALCVLDDADSAYAWKDGYSVSAQAKANAQLISAAPDLAEALEECIALWGDFLPPGNSNAMKAFTKAHAALDKAYGDSQ